MKPWYDRLHERFALSSLTKRESADEVEKWKRFISSFPETDDASKRSYYKYKCRMYRFPLYKRIIMNLLGFGALFVELVYLLKPAEELREPEKGKAVLEKAREIGKYEDIVPDQIFQEFPRVEVIENHNEKFGTLCKEAKRLYFRCWKAYPFSFFYIYFIFMELATHSSILLNQNPETTIVYINERNIASPVLTELYEKNNRKLYSFMHGDYKLQLVQAFMGFSRYYVWDQSYVDRFSGVLRCSIHEYVVYTPKKLQKKWNLEEIKPSHFCTYYFSGEKPDQIYKIAELLKGFQSKGKECAVRPHPRNKLHATLLNEVFQNTGIQIENPSTVTMKDSLASTEYVIGLQSTVLSEAYVEGRKIVLDDISDSELYALLQSQQFIMFEKEHIILSELSTLIKEKAIHRATSL